MTASRLIKLGETLHVDLASLSGRSERRLGLSLREAFADSPLSADPVPAAEIVELAATTPNAARAVLALQPGVVQVQVAELPDGAAYLCLARTVTRPAQGWGDPQRCMWWR